MTNTFHYFVLSLGYVEDSTLPVLILANGGGFTNAWDAMRSLAQVVTEWAQPEKCSRRKCPGDFKSPHCPQCGKSKEDVAPYIDVDTYVRRMWSDSLNDLREFWEILEEHEWSTPSARALSQASPTLYVEGFDRILEALINPEESDDDNLGYLFDGSHEFELGEFFELAIREESTEETTQ